MSQSSNQEMLVSQIVTSAIRLQRRNKWGRAPKSNKTQNLIFPTKSIKRKNVNRKKIQKLIFRALVLHHSQSRDCGLCATSSLRPSPPPEDEQDRALGTRMDCVRFYLSNNGTILQVETKKTSIFLLEGKIYLVASRCAGSQFGRITAIYYPLSLES